MNNNNKYKSRMVGGMAVIAMPKGTAGIEYTRTVGKGGVIFLRPVPIVVDSGNEYDAMGEQL